MNVKVSIIIPVYNKEYLIKKCIQSLLNQTLKEIEFIFVDDCSKDRSVENINSFTDSRIRLICCTENQGPMCARAYGYKAAKGEYFMFCDADDVIPSDGVQKLYEHIVQGNFDIVIGNHRVVEINGSSYVQKNSLSFGQDRTGVFNSLLSWRLSQSLCGKIYKRELFTDELLAVKEQKNGEDGWLLYQLVDKSNHIDIIDEIVYHYVMDETSTTHQRFSDEILKCVIRSNVARVQIASQYSECIALASRHLIINKFRWIEEGYDKNFINDVLKMFEKESTLTSMQNMFRYFSWVEIAKMYIKTAIRRKYGKR